MAEPTAHNAAYAGALAGMLVSRQPADAAHAAQMIAAAHAFANEVDALKAYPALTAGKESLLLFDICMSLYDGRATVSGVLTDYATMAGLANALYDVAVVNLD